MFQDTYFKYVLFKNIIFMIIKFPSQENNETCIVIITVLISQ